MSLLANKVNGIRPASLQQRTATRSVRLVVRAQETKTTEASTPGLDFNVSRSGATGYVEKDSAGQSNMFAQVTRPYEAGSDADSDANTGYNTGVAVGAGVVAAGLVAAGLFALTSGSGQPTAEPAGNYESLSAYSAKFSAELGLNKPAPVAAVLEAPALEAVAAPVAEPVVVEAAAPAVEAAAAPAVEPVAEVATPAVAVETVEVTAEASA